MVQTVLPLYFLDSRAYVIEDSPNATTAETPFSFGGKATISTATDADNTAKNLNNAFSPFIGG